MGIDGRQLGHLGAIGPALRGDFSRFALDLEDRAGELSDLILERLRRELRDPLLEEALGDEEIAAFVRASLAACLRALNLRSLPAECPPVDAHGARALARLGDLRVLLGGYRIAHMVLWERWLALIEGSELEQPVRYELLRLGSRFFFAYAAVLSDHVTESFQAELERSLRSGEQRRLQAVNDLLGDPWASADELGLNLEQHHLGLLAWGEGAQALARDLAALVGRPLLLISPYDGLWWGWLSGAQPLSLSAERELRALAPPVGASLALGLEAFGREGFRATHRQAEAARRIGLRLRLPVVAYADVAVEALLGGDGAEAEAFVAHELRGIDDDSIVSRRIRETISAYFAAEHNAASAAAALGVHQQTVANRLRAAEERLGHPVASRRFELEAALRLRAGLGR